MSAADELARRMGELMGQAISKVERDTILGYVAVEPAPAPQRDILTDLLAKKRELDALPPMLLAVKCHPASEGYLRRATAPADRDPFGLFAGPEVFWDVGVPFGRFIPAYDRATVNAWKLESWRKYLIRKLRDRMVALTEGECA